MKAILCTSFTGPGDLRLGEIDEPKPAGDEILIDVHAASVSFMDQLVVSGLYQMAAADALRAWHGSIRCRRRGRRRGHGIRAWRPRGVQRLDRRLRRTDDSEGLKVRASA